MLLAVLVQEARTHAVAMERQRRAIKREGERQRIRTELRVGRRRVQPVRES